LELLAADFGFEALDCCLVANPVCTGPLHEPEQVVIISARPLPLAFIAKAKLSLGFVTFDRARSVRINRIGSRYGAADQSSIEVVGKVNRVFSASMRDGR
jgi:hypothetical protein